MIRLPPLRSLPCPALPPAVPAQVLPKSSALSLPFSSAAPESCTPRLACHALQRGMFCKGKDAQGEEGWQSPRWLLRQRSPRQRAARCPVQTQRGAQSVPSRCPECHADSPVGDLHMTPGGSARPRWEMPACRGRKGQLWGRAGPCVLPISGAATRGPCIRPRRQGLPNPGMVLTRNKAP